MRSDIHPEYRPVAFQDMSAGTTFVTRSSAPSKETIEIDGETYPLVKVEISSESHPFYTGQMRIVDTAGRVERFERRYGRRRKAAAESEGDSESTED
ncbi:MAG: type B 50S ribosomal protein L31 [Actinomycetota bacterium]